MCPTHSFISSDARNPYLWQADDYQMRNLRHGYRKTKTACCTLPSRSAGRGRTQAGEERWRTKGAGGRRMLADEGCWRTKSAGGRRMPERQNLSRTCAVPAANVLSSLPGNATAGEASPIPGNDPSARLWQMCRCSVPQYFWRTPRRFPALCALLRDSVRFAS